MTHFEYIACYMKDRLNCTRKQAEKLANEFIASDKYKEFLEEMKK